MNRCKIWSGWLDQEVDCGRLVNAIDTSGSVLKTQHYNTDISSLGNKIDDAGKIMPDTSELVKKQIIMFRSLRLKVKYLVLLA